MPPAWRSSARAGCTASSGTYKRITAAGRRRPPGFLSCDHERSGSYEKPPIGGAIRLTEGVCRDETISPLNPTALPPPSSERGKETAPHGKKIFAGEEQAPPLRREGQQRKNPPLGKAFRGKHKLCKLQYVNRIMKIKICKPKLPGRDPVLVYIIYFMLFPRLRRNTSPGPFPRPAAPCPRSPSHCRCGHSTVQ